jgi:hypothetical protein
MARVSGSQNGKPSAPKKKKPAPKKKAAKKPAAKGKAAVPGYKVPKKLLKNTKSNRDAARPTTAQVLANQEKVIDAYNAGKPKPSTAATKKPKAGPASDWEGGLRVRDWARGQWGKLSK